MNWLITISGVEKEAFGFASTSMVWIPEYRYRVRRGNLKEEVEPSIRELTRQSACEVVELNGQGDHVHLIARIPPKVSVSSYLGRVKGKRAIGMFRMFRDLPQRRALYWQAPDASRDVTV